MCVAFLPVPALLLILLCTLKLPPYFSGRLKSVDWATVDLGWTPLSLLLCPEKKKKKVVLATTKRAEPQENR